ncbi:helix-turn-helix domain-containing protein [Rhizosphaericola mali]|uniref:helix-turn-helix domain-containing protein n=1 Tax=Rhizosphaericola mali TaxID=2545455 RepID=UPI001CDA3607|nr:AraC family transcriptional regulator [Rhizosphaericola mali]
MKPTIEIDRYVFGFSQLDHIADLDGSVIIPNGMIDMMFCKTLNGKFMVGLIGLETQPKLIPVQSIERFFCVSFKPLGLDYILKKSIADLVNGGMHLPMDFWNINEDNLADFNSFCHQITEKIKALIPQKLDERKVELFNYIYKNKGEVSIHELSEKIFWSERQINRYFKQLLGISLKSYCNILRFQASLKHIKDGELYPQLNYTDQSHFIKEIKKLSGVSPKVLFKNPDHRFLQFLVFDKD